MQSMRRKNTNWYISCCSTIFTEMPANCYNTFAEREKTSQITQMGLLSTGIVIPGCVLEGGRGKTKRRYPA